MKTLKDFNSPKVRYIFTDIDDTLTKDGRLEEEAYSALWDLYHAGIQVIPITGRPAGWCELIARQWPVPAVVGENGGFYFYYDSKQQTMNRYFTQSEETRNENQKKLKVIETEILNEIPGCAVASDQFCRMMDLAIDFCEDVPALSKEEVQNIVSIFHKYGATAKVSSIHVNGWFGNYDKLTMTKSLCENVFSFSINESKANEECAFIGDSPNDEPMFQFFKNSFAVANIKNFLEDLKHKPQFVCSLEGGKGFREFANHLLSLRI